MDKKHHTYHYTTHRRKQLTIIYHNFSLFIDIFLIKRCYLCLFICFFCMLDDSWRMDCRSQDSGGKRGVLMQFREDQKNTRKIMENHIFPEDEGSQKGRRSWATEGPHPQAQATPRTRLEGVWPTWLASDSALSPISSSRNAKTRGETTERFHRLCGAENTERERALRQTDFCQGNSFPERGDRHHQHRHQARLHWDHHHPHHHLHQHHHSVPL